MFNVKCNSNYLKLIYKKHYKQIPSVLVRNWIMSYILKGDEPIENSALGHKPTLADFSGDITLALMNTFSQRF